jgi:mannonate dehydratase
MPGGKCKDCISNDPPTESLLGVHSLIYNSDCYRKAFAMANDSFYIGMKLCVGCWLEGGKMFGNIMEDIKEVAQQNKILSVYFRNVSSTMPYFEETLAEDGYADMYAIMKQLVHSGYKGLISVDHAFFSSDVMGGYFTSLGCSTAYMKGLLHATLVEQECFK